jgi:hypothetical protein
MPFVHIIIAVIAIALVIWAYQRLIPMAKLDGNLKTIVDVVAVICITCCIIWFVVLPLASILFGMMGGGGFRVGFRTSLLLPA